MIKEPFDDTRLTLRVVAYSYLVLLVGLVAVSSLLMPVVRVHASSPVGTVGTVCVAGGGDPSCPSSPAVITGLVGTQVSVSVNVANTAIYNSFAILVKADPSVLNATSFDLSGTVLSSPVVDAVCINGNHAAGSKGCSAQDGPGVAHLAASAGCAGVTLACGFGGGHLFNINYNVLSASAGTPIAFQTGCAASSNGTSCADIQFITADILCCPPPNPENLQTATFVSGPGAVISIQQTVSFGLATATATGIVVLDMTTKNLTGSVSVTVVNSTTGQTVFSKTFSVSMIFGSGQSVKFILFLPVAKPALGLVCSVSLGSNQSGCFLVRDPDISRAGHVNIVDVTTIFIDFYAVQGTPLYDPAVDLDGNGMVDFIDASIVIGAFFAPVFS